jgi:hypothetical protein
MLSVYGLSMGCLISLAKFSSGAIWAAALHVTIESKAGKKERGRRDDLIGPFGAADCEGEDEAEQNAEN